MSIKNIKKRFFSLVSDNKSNWLENAKWRKDNEYWLDTSFLISVKILSALRENKNNNNSLPKNKDELAEAMQCSSHYINKILRGKENLQIETICKIQTILNIKIIEILI